MDISPVEWALLLLVAVYCLIAIWLDARGRVERTYTGIEHWKNLN